MLMASSTGGSAVRRNSLILRRSVSCCPRHFVAFSLEEGGADFAVEFVEKHRFDSAFESINFIFVPLNEILARCLLGSVRDGDLVLQPVNDLSWDHKALQAPTELLAQTFFSSVWLFAAAAMDGAVIVRVSMFL